MRFPSLFLFAIFAAACGGSVDAPPDTNAPAQSNDSPSNAPAASSPSASSGSSSGSSEPFPGGTCAVPGDVVAKSGGTVKQPSGSVQRFEILYQGSELAVRALRGVDMVVSGSDGPFTAGKNSGYWAEVRAGDGSTTFTRGFRDPTIIEAPSSAPNGGFTNSTKAQCEPKTILVDVPRAQTGSVLVVFGSPYGTQEGAVEIGRFTLE